MLSLSNTDLPETLSWFKSKGYKVSFIVPTKTGLKKSIMDATEDLRNFLSKGGLHDFSNQKQGTTNKKLIETLLISENSFHKTKTSLYRPETKKGDPRIWIYELGKYSRSGDLLAFLISKERLIVINCSNSKLTYLDDFLKKNLRVLSFNTSPASNELLQKLKVISNKGFIKSLRKGDTGVGFTLETLLGISANSSKNPDYKGIEIKSGRNRNSKGNLFSMAPNWEVSNLKSGNEIVNKHGRPNSKHNFLKTVFHTIRGDKENNWGLKLSVEESLIHQIFIENNTEEKDVSWLLNDFESRLISKHKETFWVQVDSRERKGNEEFHYKSIIHTGDVDISSIPFLIENGMITLDYLIWEKAAGWEKYKGKRGFDYLWKLSNKKHRNLLFKFTKEYIL
tara:strand:- start:34 stop:1218 length:1185 start_codon:yes stop_codon:yes gene_type:complete